MFAFLHIPKTAGLSIERIVRETLNPATTLRIIDIGEVAYRTDEWLASREFITGHFGFSIFRRLPEGCRSFTMLRDPVSRVRSQYRYSCDLEAGGGRGNPHRAFRRGRSLAELLEDHDDPVVDSLFRDTQTWALVSDYQHHCRIPGLDPDTILETACNNLASLHDFGIVEETEDSLRALSLALGTDLGPSATGVRENVTKTPDTGLQEPGLDDLIRRHNSLDERLYRWARAEFSRRRHLTANPSGLPGTGTSPRASPRTDRRWIETERRAERMEVWARRAERSLAKERETSADLRAWALRVEASLAKEREISADLRAWALRTEEMLARERETSASLRALVSRESGGVP